MRNKINLWGTHGSTILGITLVLFMLNLLVVIEYHSYRLTHSAQEKITYKVDLVPEIDDTAAQALKADIQRMDYVKHVDYISKTKAAEIFSQELDEDFVDFIGYNPLTPSLMVNFYANLMPDNSGEVLDRFCKEVGNRDEVTGVVYQENVVEELQEVFYKLSWFFIVFIALLLIITIVLINSLIRIAIYNQRETIRTMRLVGATRRFIARPFVWRSIAYAALGGCIAAVLTFITLWVFENEFSLNLIGADHLAWYAVIDAAVALVGIIISYASTALTVRRYIAKH
ncbi:MAG: permease-like cell division protein FtsX [Bacteroidales bacterium]|nr:permease-like cell division protein FtsX [Bacteroidales bacterium]